MSKYDIVGIDGNAYSIMGYVAHAMREEGRTQDEIKKYQSQAMSGDYNNLLRVSANMIDTLNECAGT
jgi:hypothetical protein